MKRMHQVPKGATIDDAEFWKSKKAIMLQRSKNRKNKRN